MFATRLTRHDARAAPPAAPSARSSAPPPPRPTGPAARASARRCGVQRPPRPPRDGARRGGRDPLRRLGARRPRARRPRDGAPGAAGVPDRLGQPARRRRRLRARARAAWRRRCRTATRWSAATACDALEEVVEAIGAEPAPPSPRPLARPSAEDEEEPWASATPVAGQLGGDAERLRPEPRQHDAGMERDERRRQDLHLPGLRAARGAAAPAGRAAAELLRPRGPQRADRAPGAPRLRPSRDRTKEE